MVYGTNCNIISKSKSRVKEELNINLLHHLLQLTSITQLSDFAKSLKNLLEEMLVETDLGFGNYAGEIFERFDEKELTSEKDIETLLYYLTLITGQNEKKILLENLFLYNQQEIFETKVASYMTQEKLFNYYIMLKANGMFQKLNLPLSINQGDFLSLVERFNYSSFFIEIEYFKDYLTNVFNDWTINGFKFNGSICDEYFIEFALSFFKEVNQKVFNNYLLKYFKTLKGNPTEKRLNFILSCHKNQPEDEIVFTLMEELTRQDKDKRQYIRIFMDKCMDYLLKKENTVEYMEKVISHMKHNYRFKEIFNEEYNDRMLQYTRKLNPSTYEFGKKIFKALNLSVYFKIELTDEFKEEVFQAIINNNPLNFKSYSFDLMDKIDSYVIIKIIYDKLFNSDKITTEEKQKLSKAISTIKVNKGHTSDMMLKIVFSLRDYGDLKELLNKYLSFSIVTNKCESLITEEYLIRLDYDKKTFAELVVQIAEEENLNVYEVVSNLLKTFKFYYIKFHQENGLKTKIAIYIFNIVQSYLETSYFHNEFLNKLITLDDFIEYFNQLDSEEKQNIISFLDEYNVSRHQLFATEEELIEEEKSKIRAFLSGFRYNSIDFIGRYKEIEDEEKQKIYIDVFMNEFLISIITRGSYPKDALKFVKHLINEQKIEPNDFWELV